MDVGRIVVDARGFAEYNHAASPSLERLDTDYGKKLAENRRDKSRALEDEMYYVDRRRIPPSYPDSEDTSFNMPENEELSMDLPEELVRYCVPFVRGFNLATKSWCIFLIKAIQNIDWNDTAFDKLMLRQEYKTMILAFVHSHLRSQDNFDDVIKGKGQGFVMLLGGEPGTGKTLTAESVAEAMKCPLYSLSAGELGTDSDDVETSLRRVLDLCAKWHAVLLVDECDVFLEQRSVSDLERNKLVSVFLRLLEYYKGVMLLTTNRESTIDVAFKSRIHLTIHYPKLGPETRRRIWQNFIEPTPVNSAPGHIGISPAQSDALAEEDLNGREIKGVVRAARLLASYYGVPLSFEHLTTVINVKNEEREGRNAMS